jgi:hypothetical protein
MPDRGRSLKFPLLLESSSWVGPLRSRVGGGRRVVGYCYRSARNGSRGDRVRAPTSVRPTGSLLTVAIQSISGSGPSLGMGRRLYTKTLRMRELTMSISITVSTTMMMIAAVSEYWKLRMFS